jgi:hypothetical protein
MNVKVIIQWSIVIFPDSFSLMISFLIAQYPYIITNPDH